MRIPVWGHAIDSCPCMIPGPVTEATEGDTLEITLHNALTERDPHTHRPGGFYVYDRDLHHIPNGDVFPGGMMKRLEVTP